MELESPLEIEFKTNQLGKEQLVINGCKYSMSRHSGETTYWRCIYHWCPVSAIFRAGKLEPIRETHICTQSEKHHQKKQQLAQMGLQSETIVLKSSNTRCAPSKPTSTTLSPPALFPIFYRAKTKPKVVMDASQHNLTMNTLNHQTEMRVTEGKLSVQLKTTEDVILSTNSYDKILIERPFSPVKQGKVEVSVIDSDNDNDNDCWKRQMLADAESIKSIYRVQEASDIREAWSNNRIEYNDKYSANHKKWLTSNAVWSCSLDWPTRSHCMKLIKPIRGTGIHVEQTVVPIKIIDHVNSTAKVADKIAQLGDYAWDDSIPDKAILSEKPFKNVQLKTPRKRKITDITDVNNSVLVDESRKVKAVKSADVKVDKCPICNKFLQSSMERHLNNVHNRIKHYECQYCAKAFTQGPKYRSHMKAHKNGKSFCCVLCPVKLTSKVSLKRHLMTHGNGKNFLCFKCNRTFRNAEFLDLHNRKFHRILSNEGSSSLNPEDDEVLKIRMPESSPIPSVPPRRRPIKRRVALNCEESSSTKKFQLMGHSDFFKKKQTLCPRGELEPGPSKPSRPYTLEELQYMDFLQPRVVLSKNLNELLNQFSYEARSISRNVDIANLSFHNYARPFES